MLLQQGKLPVSSSLKPKKGNSKTDKDKMQYRKCSTAFKDKQMQAKEKKGKIIRNCIVIVITTNHLNSKGIFKN